MKKDLLNENALASKIAKLILFTKTTTTKNNKNDDSSWKLKGSIKAFFFFFFFFFFFLEGWGGDHTTFHYTKLLITKLCGGTGKAVAFEVLYIIKPRPCLHS